MLTPQVAPFQKNHLLLVTDSEVDELDAQLAPLLTWPVRDLHGQTTVSCHQL